jgi:hypothetical protein
MLLYRLSQRYLAHWPRSHSSVKKTGGVGHFAVQEAWARIRHKRKKTSCNLRKRVEDFDELETFMQQKTLKPLIESVYPMENSSEAFKKAEFGKPRGKVLIKL